MRWLVQRNNNLPLIKNWLPWKKWKPTRTFPLRAADISVNLNRPSPETTVRHFQVLWAIKRPVVQLPFRINAYILATIINRIKLLRLLIKRENCWVFFFHFQLMFSIKFFFYPSSHSPPVRQPSPCSLYLWVCFCCFVFLFVLVFRFYT